MKSAFIIDAATGMSVTVGAVTFVSGDVTAVHVDRSANDVKSAAVFAFTAGNNTAGKVHFDIIRRRGLSFRPKHGTDITFCNGTAAVR